jgi:DNA-binding NarL/FixJ family response regulator
MQTSFNSPGSPGALLDYIAALEEGDTLALRNLSVLGPAVIRKAVLRALIRGGIRLKVFACEPELAAELEQWRRDFRDASIVRARARGSYSHGAGGRKRSVDREPIAKLLDQGLRPIEVARRLNISPSTAYHIAHELRRDEVKSAAK